MANGILEQLMSGNVPTQIKDALQSLMTMPSWLDQANQQTQRDISAYQRGGVPALMADTGTTQDLAGGFGGITKNVGIKAYHGSPYDFDKFDLSKIGTGEGAQAYGHGLYFAENPKVAQEYKDALTQSKFKYAGHTEDATNALTALGVPPATASELLYLTYEGGHKTGGNLAKFLADEPNLKPYASNPQVRAIIDKYVEVPPPGKMYEVNINARPEQMLNWDAPLSQQPIAPAFKQFGISPVSNMPGSDAYFTAVNRLANDEITAGRGASSNNRMAASAALNELGIPGIKYLDQGSRGVIKFGPNAAGNWDLAHEIPKAQTSNYVVFNPELIDILRKYMLPGSIAPTTALMASQSDNQQ